MGETEIALAHGQLSARQLAAGAYGPALESMTTALRLAPGIDSLWAQFSDLIRYFNFRYPADPVRGLLARALEHAAVDPGNLVRPITSIALSHPRGALEEPLLLRMLEDVVIRDVALERVITDARRKMLDEPLALPVMVAIAHQCFNTEYVFDESAEERSKINRLRGAIASAEAAPPHWYAAYAAYRPLLTLQAENIPINSLARRQIDEPLEEQRLAASVPTASTAKGAVSAAVQAQYEENPYPRWVRTQSALVARTLAQSVRELFPQVDANRVSENPRILVAGCGTGQHAIDTARRFAGASVLAVDLSLASLGYAKRKTRELGVNNIEYRQADILSLGALEERFELIECSGVLHHLEDPFEGWRVLAALLKPCGFMRVGLYSEAGRRSIVRARELIAAEGFKPDPDGIRACRAAIRARESDELFGKIVRNEDFYSMSGCRDLLFHVQEHRFSLPRVESMIGRLGLAFLGFEFPDSGATVERYRARFPADRYFLNLKNWDQIEREIPDTFARMYQFWVRGAGE